MAYPAYVIAYYISYYTQFLKDELENEHVRFGALFTAIVLLPIVYGDALKNAKLIKAEFRMNISYQIRLERFPEILQLNLTLD